MNKKDNPGNKIFGPKIKLTKIEQKIVEEKNFHIPLHEVEQFAKIFDNTIMMENLKIYYDAEVKEPTKRNPSIKQYIENILEDNGCSTLKKNYDLFKKKVEEDIKNVEEDIKNVEETLEYTNGLDEIHAKFTEYKKNTKKWLEKKNILPAIGFILLSWEGSKFYDFLYRYLKPRETVLKNVTQHKQPTKKKAEDESICNDPFPGISKYKCFTCQLIQAFPDTKFPNHKKTKRCI